ncbi:hypothetical protein N4R57_14455 [Rhodobacteraceae bacterium D3-12]|nr:hypothetical protein N4R57_14455 [Rhodobacteraceae bacterium D3-12]
MSVKIDDNTVQITESDVRNRYIPLRHVIQMFPPDCLGGDNGSTDPGALVTIHLDGVKEPVVTDLYKTKKTPRKTGTVREFYERGNAKGGSHLFIEKLAPREFRITVIS